jgi:hypothetical protein
MIILADLSYVALEQVDGDRGQDSFLPTERGSTMLVTMKLIGMYIRNNPSEFVLIED